MIDTCAGRGIGIKWFGRREPVGFTSSFADWQYVRELPSLPRTRAMLDRLCDMRIPLSLTHEDCEAIAGILSDAVAAASES